jgi:hypothetical protein
LRSLETQWKEAKPDMVAGRMLYGTTWRTRDRQRTDETLPGFAAARLAFLNHDAKRGIYAAIGLVAAHSVLSGVADDSDAEDGSSR